VTEESKSGIWYIVPHVVGDQIDYRHRLRAGHVAVEVEHDTLTEYNANYRIASFLHYRYCRWRDSA
jgi:hypothetical protein